MAHEVDTLFSGCALRLSNGRNLGYIIVGDLNSEKVVVLCNGSPGSRLEARVHGNSAFAAGVRLICVDRQGVGLSDPLKDEEDNSFEQFASDVGELLDHLCVHQYSVVGYSTGGPAALSLAKFDERVSRVGLLASVAPLSVFGTNDMPIEARFMFFLSKRAPSLLTALFSSTVDNHLSRKKAIKEPEHLDRLIEEFTESRVWQGTDKEYIENIDWTLRRLFMVSTIEAFRQGAKGCTDYGNLITKHWGFLLASIEVPVHLYHGERDETVPRAMTEYLESRLRYTETRYIQGQGHLSLICRYMGQTFKDVTQDLESNPQAAF
eukprot:CAMPEP_0181025704 /NCGR_PEP_ID=MMETSP1070-20121207/3242_1 /TAXON_ID=265543 /ORGANISM="Minutocellus polymorphus, Strain NH13" /LENGTH=320 /DNA_ID=CAMNT_0023102835 /DNA_START=137 /DNA_END=1102 /DNA_ORIENTATION=+